MIHFLSLKQLSKKGLIFLLITLTMIGNISFYNHNQEEITHFKPYYLKSYAYAAAAPLSLNKTTQNLGNTKSVPVLMYHGISGENKDMSTKLEVFNEEMVKLKNEGYQTVKLEDFNKYIKGEKELPSKSFLLTFDDARKDAYYPVEPILERLNYSAVMFVITSTLDQESSKFHLTKEELTRMQKTGHWELQPHTNKGHGLIEVDTKGTKGHFYTNKMWLKAENRLETDIEFKERVESDLNQAKNDIKSSFNVNSIGFAFPYGDYGQESINYKEAISVLPQIVNENFDLAFYQSDHEKGYSYNYPKTDFMVKRITADSVLSADGLIDVVRAGQEKNLPLTFDKFTQSQGWIKTWGSVHFKETNLVLQSNEESNGSGVLLDGTSSLGDYRASSNIYWDKGSTLTYIFRQKDPNNYYFIDITKDKVKLGAIINKQENLILEKSINLNKKYEHLINYEIRGDSLNLEIDDQIILTNVKFGNQIANGGIGFRIWDQTVDNALLSIRKLNFKNIK